MWEVLVELDRTRAGLTDQLTGALRSAMAGSPPAPDCRPPATWPPS